MVLKKKKKNKEEILIEEFKKRIKSYQAELSKLELHLKEMEAKMEAVKWEEVEEKLLTGYLAETESLTMEEEFSIYQITNQNKKVEETIIQKKIDEILKEFQGIILKGDHDIGNYNLIEHAIRLMDDIPTTCKLRQRLSKENEQIRN